MNVYRSLHHGIQMLCLVLICSLLACKQTATCYEPQNVALRGGFYYYDVDQKLTDTLLENAVLIFGEGNNYFQQLKQNNRFSFPLSQSKDTVSFVFQADSSSTASDQLDTLQLSYNRELTFISTACGFQHFFQLQGITYSKHVIDSVIIFTPAITNDINKQHLQIVLKD